MSKWRKKPIVIEAFKWTGGEDQTEDPEWIREAIENKDAWIVGWMDDTPPGLFMHTLEGTMQAQSGDYVIRGIKGEIYPCKPDIFEATYEFVSD